MSQDGACHIVPLKASSNEIRSAIDSDSPMGVLLVDKGGAAS